MKKILIMIIMISSLSHSKIPDDKAKHMFVGTAIYFGCLLTKGAGEAIELNMDYLNTRTCLIPVFVAGIGKEVYDKRHPNKHSAEFMDAVATVAIPVGSFVLFEW